MSGQAEMKSTSAAVTVFVVVAVVAFVAIIVILIILMTSSSSSRTDFFTTQQTKLVATGSVGQSAQGYAIGLSRDGNTLAVSGFGDNSSAGAIWVFVRAPITNIWTQQALLIPTGIVTGDIFGRSLAISNDGNTIVAGADIAADTKGGVWIFNRVGTVWTENAIGKILPVTYPLVGASSTFFGWSLSMRGDGNMFVAGAYSDDSSIGAAYVYEKVSNVWTEKQKLVGTGAPTPAYQGWSVSVSENGEVIAVGGTNDSASVGATWIYTRSGTTYVQAQKIVGTGGVGTSLQGTFVSLNSSGNILAVGGLGDNAFLGAVWMFKREGALWVQDGQKLVGTGLTPLANFGVSVALNGDGNILAISCSNDNTNEGGFYVFIHNGTNWVQKQNIKTLPTGAIGVSTYFGTYISMSRDGKTLAVGAGEDNAGIGAVYIFI